MAKDPYQSSVERVTFDSGDGISNGSTYSFVVRRKYSSSSDSCYSDASSVATCSPVASGPGSYPPSPPSPPGPGDSPAQCDSEMPGRCSDGTTTTISYDYSVSSGQYCGGESATDSTGADGFTLSTVSGPGYCYVWTCGTVNDNCNTLLRDGECPSDSTSTSCGYGDKSGETVTSFGLGPGSETSGHFSCLGDCAGGRSGGTCTSGYSANTSSSLSSLKLGIKPF